MRTRLAVALLLLVALPAACKRKTLADGGTSASFAATPASALPSETTIVVGHGETLPVLTGDLTEIKKRGVVRVLVPGGEAAFLPRRGSAAADGRSLVLDLARRHALRVHYLLVAHHGDLLPLLEQGKGDLVAADLTVTTARSKRILFTKPTATVSELVIARKGDATAPKSVFELAGKEIHVRASSSYMETLIALAPKHEGLKVVAAPENVDSETLVYDVTRGNRPLTVVDSHLFAGISAYNPEAHALFAIATGRQIAWAVRKESPALKAAADAFLLEKAVSSHTEKRDTGDLEALRKRGSLRVLTANNAVSYFLHRGEQLGFEYELVKMLANALGLRLEVVVPPSRDLLVPWLMEGRGDLIAASFTVTPAREKVLAFSKPYLFAQQMLVERKGSPALPSLDALQGKTIHVRKSSSYRERLDALREKHGPFAITDAPEALETEQLIRRVARGELPATVADSHILEVELAYQSDALGTLALADRQPIAFAMRPANTKLRAEVDAFVGRSYKGVEYNMARNRYFKSPRGMALARESQGESQSQISKYDEIIKKHATAQSLDWRLVAAQAHQESRFDPNAKSFAGALGLFQVMPKTGKGLGITNLADPEEGTRAGLMLLAKLLSDFEPHIPLKHRVRFALAAYNAGKGHVDDARRLAVELGLNVDKWFGHVERAMLLLQQPAYYNRARYGYCRGTEPVKYVSQIQNRYDNYVKIIQR